MQTPGDLPLPSDPGSSSSGRDARANRLVELLTQSARGREAAFAELYDLTCARVHGVILPVVRSREQAAEVTQETYLDIWEHAAHYSAERGSALSWMLTIAHRRAVDRVRSMTRSTAREQWYASRDQRRESDEVWESVEHTFEGQRVRRALQTLTDRQREVIDLAYFGGYTQSEVAGVLKVPLGTVKTRIRDGLIKLRDALGGGDRE